MEDFTEKELHCIARLLQGAIYETIMYLMVAHFANSIVR